MPRANPDQGLTIGLPLCKRIVEMHGGHLRIHTGDDDSVSLVMELPTGAEP